MQSFVILFLGSVVADYPYYTDYNTYNSVYAPTTSNFSSIKRTWDPNGPFTFGLSNQLLKPIFYLPKHAETNLTPTARYKPGDTVGRPWCQSLGRAPLRVDFRWNTCL